MIPIVYTSMYNKFTGIVKRLAIKACDLHDVNIHTYAYFPRIIIFCTGYDCVNHV